LIAKGGDPPRGNQPGVYGVADNSKRRRPAKAIVWYDGEAFEMDLAACRRALLKGAIEGRWVTREDLAREIDRSRSTISRFLVGHQTSLGVTLAILGKLGLKFAEVAKPCRPE
jgi:hypothetical protein